MLFWHYKIDSLIRSSTVCLCTSTVKSFKIKFWSFWIHKDRCKVILVYSNSGVLFFLYRVMITLQFSGFFSQSLWSTSFSVYVMCKTTDLEILFLFSYTKNFERKIFNITTSLPLPPSSWLCWEAFSACHYNVNQHICKHLLVTGSIRFSNF